jgi:hypothetical protein
MPNETDLKDIQEPGPAPRSARRERAFEIPLTARVRGRDALDREFAEEARLASLSSEEATLRLRPKVRVGTKLLLTFQVPKTSLLETPLHVALSGTVSRVTADPASRRDILLVLLRLDKNFRISSPAA